MKAGGAEVSFITKHPAIEDPVGSVEATPGAHKEVQTLGDNSGSYPTASKPTAPEGDRELSAPRRLCHLQLIGDSPSISPQADARAISFLPLNHNGTFSASFLVKRIPFFEK